MGFVIKDIVSIHMNEAIPEHALKEIMMQNITNDSGDNETLNATNERRSNVIDRKVEVNTETIPDYIATTVQNLILQSSISIDEIDFLIVASKYADYRHPFVAATVQDTLELKKSIFTFDLHGSDDIFLKAIQFSSSLLDGSKYKQGIVVFTDELYEIAKFKNRRIQDDFVDITSAMLLEYSSDSGVEAVQYWNEGNRARYHVLNENGEVDTSSYHYMSGEDMQKNISSINHDNIDEILAEAGLTVSDISLFFINTSQEYLISIIQRYKNIPENKIIWENETKGMLSKFYPVMIQEKLKEGIIKKGDYILLSSFGQGLSYGSMILKI